MTDPSREREWLIDEMEAIHASKQTDVRKHETLAGETAKMLSADAETIRTLTAKVAELERDAERYRWIRVHECSDDVYCDPAPHVLRGGFMLDEAIDAALAQARGEG